MNVLEKSINDYFDSKKFINNGRWDGINYMPLTIPSLCFSLGWSEEMYLKLVKEVDGDKSIKESFERIRAWTYEYLLHGKNPDGAIFIINKYFN
jgi:hypothetical protein